MKIRTALFYILSFLWLSSCSSGQPNEVVLAQSPAQWKKDLEFLAAQLPALHKNAFHTVTKETFHRQVTDLSQKLDKLNNEQTITELIRLVALIGDGHTHLDLPPNLNRFPFEIARFDNEYRIVVTTAQHSDLLGLRLTAIDQLPVDAVHKRLMSLVPQGENNERTLFTTLQLFSAPQILYGDGIIKNINEATFTFLTDNDEKVEKKLSPVNLRSSGFSTIPAGNVPLMLQSLQEAWWVRHLPQHKAIYFRLNAYPDRNTFERRSQELSQLINNTGTDKLIIDFRRNGGGDFLLFRNFLLPVLKQVEKIYVITGPATFSASMVNTLDLKNELKAIQVGLPTGARPNSYSEHGQFFLPNSRLRVSYATTYYQFASDADTAVVPEKIISQSWRDYVNGIDPCVEWILNN